MFIIQNYRHKLSLEEDLFQQFDVHQKLPSDASTPGTRESMGVFFFCELRSLGPAMTFRIPLQLKASDSSSPFLIKCSAKSEPQGQFQKKKPRLHPIRHPFSNNPADEAATDGYLSNFREDTSMHQL